MGCEVHFSHFFHDPAFNCPGWPAISRIGFCCHDQALLRRGHQRSNHQWSNEGLCLWFINFSRNVWRCPLAILSEPGKIYSCNVIFEGPGLSVGVLSWGENLGSVSISKWFLCVLKKIVDDWAVYQQIGQRGNRVTWGHPVSALLFFLANICHQVNSVQFKSRLYDLSRSVIYCDILAPMSTALNSVKRK